MKKKVLVVEAGSHYKIMEQIYHLLDDKCDLTFYLIDNKRLNYKQLFPSFKNVKVIWDRFKGIFIFAGVLFYSNRYDFINISTGPDGSHYTDWPRVFFFYLCCLFYGHKIIFTVKNIDPYLKSTPGLLAYIRNKSIKLIKRFTFETKTMRDTFIKVAGVKDVLLGVSYDRYSDVGVEMRKDKSRYSKSDKVRIGLLGSIDGERRDYGILYDALGKLSPTERDRLLFVTLGGCRNATAHKIVKKLSSLVAIDCYDGILSENDFVDRGVSCDLLISPLMSNMSYGTLKGSGSFGDVVYLRKKMIFPLQSDPMKEYKEVCIYYSNSDDLAAVFCNVDTHLKQKISDIFYDQYSTQSVFKNLTLDLHLC